MSAGAGELPVWTVMDHTGSPGAAGVSPETPHNSAGEPCAVSKTLSTHHTSNGA